MLKSPALRIGIVGAGVMAEYHVTGYRKAGAEVVAIADRNPEAGTRFARKMEIPEVYASLTELLASCHVDAVSVITPNKFHRELAIEALEHGCHVFCEKPPALSAAETMEMKLAAERNGKLLSFNFNNRAREESRAVMDYIRSGEMGRINSAQAVWMRRSGIPGFGGWFTSKSLSGGGPLIDLLHMMDLALYFMGYPEPEWVLAQTFDDFISNRNFKGVWGIPDGENGVTEVFTSGNDFETLTARYLTDYYNCSNDNTVVDDRSGKKGPEAESVTVGTVDGRTYAFVALERTGGVMVYDVTEPASAQYVNYINTRDFASIVEGSEEYEDGELDKWVTGGDVAPEGLLFLSDAVSPTGEALLLAACEVSGTVAVYQVGGEPLSVLPFTDVEARDAQAVRYVCENGLMAGVSADRFEPNGTLTRGEAVTALWALEGRPVVNYLMDFSDVDPAASYGEAVRWAASEGIAGGYGGGLFGPDDPITREQLAVMLYRYARHEGYDTAQGGMAVREFADYDQIAGYAAEAMTWAVEAGVLTATSLDTLAPGQAATRVQTAQALLALSQFTK